MLAEFDLWWDLRDYMSGGDVYTLSINSENNPIYNISVSIEPIENSEDFANLPDLEEINSNLESMIIGHWKNWVL